MLSPHRAADVERLRKHFAELNFYTPPFTTHAGELVKYLSGESEKFPRLGATLIRNYEARYLTNVYNLIGPLGAWDEFDDRILRYATHPDNWQPYEFVDKYLNPAVVNETSPNTAYLAETALRPYGIVDTQFRKLIYPCAQVDTQNQITSAGFYLLEHFKEFRAEYAPDHFRYKIPFFIEAERRGIQLPAEQSSKLIFWKTASLDYDEWFWEIAIPEPSDNDYRGMIPYRGLVLLLEYDPERFERIALKILESRTNAFHQLQLWQLLWKYFPKTHGQNQVTALIDVLSKLPPPDPRVINGPQLHGAFLDGSRGDLLSDSLEIILPAEPAKGLSLAKEVLKKGYTFGAETARVLMKYLPEVAAPLLLEEIKNLFNLVVGPQHYRWYGDNPNTRLNQFLTLLSSRQYEPILSVLWAQSTAERKAVGEMVARQLARYGDRVIPEAVALLSHKKAPVRQTAALLLSLLDTEAARIPLLAALNAETNDDARDLMLASLDGRLPQAETREALAEQIDKAGKRGKLAKPLEPWLEVTALPPLFWLGDETPLDGPSLRFLLYRMSRVADIGIDPEARPLLLLLDPARCQPFGEALLNVYLDWDAPPKLRFCLALGSRLGGETVVPVLSRNIGEWVDRNRGKMAEYGVKALALHGSNRALRAVEQFSRKYRSKNKNVGAAAEAAFQLAADELGLSPHELADSIVPDFGFEGLFRPFEAGGQSYRAFVGNDFKLQFLNEDGKLSKSVPKATPPEVQAEFKELGKEIRDLAKAQAGRMEQYLITQRRWTVADWTAFFLQKPVMFVFATRLLWGVFGADEQLEFSFLCQEDQSLVDAEFEEITLPDEVLIGMVHPLSLPATELEHWQTALGEAGVVPLFPQLDRPVFRLPEALAGLTISEEFSGLKCGGYDFVRRLEKAGWQRGSVVDAGWISGYRKEFPAARLTAFVRQQGELSVGYYEGQAELGALLFFPSGAVQFGNYVYDEPERPDDPRLVPFGQVPPVVYSEVMADLAYFKPLGENAQSEQP